MPMIYSMCVFIQCKSAHVNLKTTLRFWCFGVYRAVYPRRNDSVIWVHPDHMYLLQRALSLSVVRNLLDSQHSDTSQKIPIADHLPGPKLSEARDARTLPKTNCNHLSFP